MSLKIKEGTFAKNDKYRYCFHYMGLNSTQILV